MQPIPTVKANELPDNLNIAVLLPCYNEEITIGDLVKDFNLHLPQATVYVYDNNSTDRTAEIARAAGAEVVFSPDKGKGNVIRHMFRTIDADLYIMADGDNTNPPEFAPLLIQEQIKSGAEMIVGTRLQHSREGAMKFLNEFGNKFVSRLVSLFFSVKLADVLSGYRVFTKRFVESVYLEGTGFEIETELTVQALIKKLKIHEVMVRYDCRPEGSESKVHVFADGVNDIMTMLKMFIKYKPLKAYSLLAICFLLITVATGWLPMRDCIDGIETSHRLLSGIAGLFGLLTLLSLGLGFILNGIIRSRFESLDTMEKLFRRIDNLKH